ncbi:glycosyltransferase [Lactobacillus amylovorus]|nr:glycosyltransferase [Lactobacillus amylovorus]
MIKDGDLISVIVPVYNVESYIDKCIKSIVGQTYSNLEIILVNDGSTDNSLMQCIKWGKKDSRIIVYDKKNGGVSDARNYGIKHAHGKWIMFIDSDDWVSPYFCEFALCAVASTNSDLGMFRYTKVDSEKDLDVSKLSNENYQNLKKKEAISLILDDSQVGNYAMNKIYKKDLFKKYQFQVGKTFEDIGLIYKIVDEAKRCVFIDCSLYYYFQRKNSLMHSMDSNDINNAFTFRYDQFIFLKKKYPDLLPKAIPSMLMNSLQLIYKCRSNKFKNNRRKALKIIKSIQVV